MRLVLENAEGKAVRTFQVSGDSAVVISRGDTRRVEIHSNTSSLEAKKVKFEKIGNVSREALEKSPVKVGSHGQLRLVSVVGDTVRNTPAQEDDSALSSR